MKTSINFSGALLLIFIVLKLTHTIDWSWLWVLSPLWISFGLNLFIGIIIVVTLIVSKINKRYGK